MKKRGWTRRQVLETGGTILAGGSGHGFKHGPALGERAAAAVLGERRPDVEFSLSLTKIASFP